MRTHSWAVLLLWAVLLTAGCATPASRVGGYSRHGARALSAVRAMAAETPPLQTLAPAAFEEEGEQERLHRRRSARGLGSDVALASADDAQGSPSCGGEAVPPGWPDFASGDEEALLAPFLTCASPAEFVALQERVDMPRLVEALTDWAAVRLGSLGPVREDAAGILNRKRVSFILQATEKYGAAHAEEFVRFLVDSAHDDELREILFRLAQDKRLETTLGRMPRAKAELEARSLKLSARPDRDFENVFGPRLVETVQHPRRAPRGTAARGGSLRLRGNARFTHGRRLLLLARGVPDEPLAGSHRRAGGARLARTWARCWCVTWAAGGYRARSSRRHRCW